MTMTVENPLPKGDPQAVADEFGEFFLNKIINIRKLFEGTPTLDLSVSESIPLFRSFSPLSQTEVRTVVSGMKTKSCELDPLPTHVLKSLIDKLLPALTKIVNMSLTTGQFSTCWKCAIVRPLLKKSGLELTHKNYRPVSNLQFISKLVERCALLQFIDHCDLHKLIPDYQSAYRKGYSCETSVLKLLNNRLWAMETQSVLPVILLDLSAAFDTVDHDLFIRVLQNNFAITDTALSWFENYLRPRSFKVCVDNKYSKSMDLQFSVPQGSAAGANFFTAYCKSLPECIPAGVELQGFADDHFTHKPFKASSRSDELLTISLLESTFNKIQHWMTGMRLKLNPEKTEFIIIGNSPQLKKLTTKSINAGNSTVERTNVVKCLGTYVDENLNLRHHVNNKCKIAMFNLLKIKSIRHYLTKETTQTLVLSLEMSHLDYTNSILAGSPASLIYKYQRIQSMCAKLVLSRSRLDSSRQSLKDLHWLPIVLRIKFKIACLIYKCLNMDSPDYLESMLTYKTPSRSLRSNAMSVGQLTVPYTKHKTFAQRSFSVQGPLIWNSLPLDLRLSNSYELFTKNLKTHLFTLY